MNFEEYFNKNPDNLKQEYFSMSVKRFCGIYKISTVKAIEYLGRKKMLNKTLEVKPITTQVIIKDYYYDKEATIITGVESIKFSKKTFITN